MKQVMYSVEQVAEKIRQGKVLFLAGDERALSRLPKGNWAGGTIPYFMAEQGGRWTRDEIYVTELPDYIKGIKFSVYDKNELAGVYNDVFENGFSLILIPASSEVHLNFAVKAPEYSNFGAAPLVGWIAGVHLDDLGKSSPKVYNGKSGEHFENKAVVVHAQLPEDRYADMDIVNIFEQGDGDELTFDHTGWESQEVFVNGVRKNFVDYINSKALDIRLPLVADYSGAKINISFQSVDKENDKVAFYAPVFKGVKYKQAKSVPNYVQSFVSQMPTGQKDSIVFSCNCILNYLYSELEGKQTGGITGPITFGEVAYQLLNQTMVYLTIEKNA